METDGSGLIRFVVLLPHRDCGKILRSYRRGLFAAGLPGAFSFPGAAPLGLVSRPFHGEELKALALALRQASLEGNRGGWIRAGDAGTEPLPSVEGRGSVLALYGPVLDLPPDEGLRKKFLSPFPRLILAAALVRGTPDPGSLPPPPPLAFRAAAAANMVFRPLPRGGDFSYEWRIGKPAWLPRVKGPGHEP